jgi:hypothetical protein
VLVARQSEGALVRLGQSLEARFERLARFVLDTSVFDEHGEMVFAIVSGLPTKFVDIAFELERPGWLEFPT